MTALVRAQLVAIRTLRSTYLLVGALLALLAIIVFSSLAKAGEGDLVTATQLREPIMACALMSAVVLSIFAAMRVSGEYRHHTIAQRFLAAPQRWRVLSSELLTYAALGLIVGAAALAVAVASAQPRLSGKDLSLGLSTELLAAGLLSILLYTLLGVAVGAITRSQPAAVGAIVGVFFAEKLFGSLLPGDTAVYLPYELLNPLLGLSESPLSRATAALVLTAITFGVCAVAYVLVSRRDVT